MQLLTLRRLLARATPWLALAAFVLLAAFALAPLLPSGSAQPTAQAQATPAFHVLVFSETKDFRHTSIPAAITTITQLGAANNFAVDTTEDSTRFNDANLAKYQAVVFLMTTGDVLNATQQAAFERYIRAGGGYAGIHSASDTEYDWPWYGQLVGAYFKNHPGGDDQFQQATVLIEDRSHPSTAPLTTTWTRTDEWYSFQSNPRGLVKVLATLDESSYRPRSDGIMDDHPIAWYHAFDGGRSWYTAGGHSDESYVEPLFQAHLLGGIRYAAGAALSDPPTPTATLIETTTPDPNSTASPTVTGDQTPNPTPGQAPPGRSWLPLLVGPTTPAPTPPATETATATPTGTPTASDGFRPLFNGRDLEGWYTWLPSRGTNSDPEGVFKVEAGMLHILDLPVTKNEREFGYLATLAEYENYHLRFQYRWGQKKFAPRTNEKRDSGVLYGVYGDDKIWPRSAEAQVQEGDTGDLFLLGPITVSTTVKSLAEGTKTYQEGGVPFRRTSGRIIKSQTLDSLTDWNTVEVIMRGDEFTHIVNGVVVNRGRLSRPDSDDANKTIPMTRGRILFQAEGAEVFYRDIGIKQLSTSSD